MSSPNGLSIKTSLDNMVIGDCIPCRYTATTSNSTGYFSELGTCAATEIPVISSATPDGLFYFNKVDKGLLVADRVIQHSISWDTLNNAKYIEGKIFLVDSFERLWSCNNINISDNVITLNSSLYSVLKVSCRAIAANEDFTIAWIMHPTTVSGHRRILTSNIGAFNSTSFMCRFNNDGTMIAMAAGVTISVPYSSTNRAHIAIVRKSGVLYLFVDGVLKSYATCTEAITDTSYYCGGFYNYDNTEYFDGSISLPYINIGTGLWTSDFEPPIMYGLRESLIRSLNGGNAYLGTDGQASLTDCNLGVWPINNEWDKYIVKSSLGNKIIPGDNNVWNKDIECWCKSTPIIGYTDGLNGTGNESSRRIWRGKYGTDLNYQGAPISSSIVTGCGFRPVLEYIESDSKATTLWY